MRKYLTTAEYKNRNSRNAANLLKRRLKSNYKQLLKNQYRSGYVNTKTSKKSKRKPAIENKPIVFAPVDLRLIENTEECLFFFRCLRSEDYLSRKGSWKFVIMSLKNVRMIDYGSISILTSISDDLKLKKIVLKGDFPDDQNCKNILVDSSFLSHMVDNHGHSFPKAEKSELIFFEKGCGRLSLRENMAISNTVKNVVKHLTGELNQCLAVKTIILEICGNSIEWGGTDHKQWLLGVKYEDDSVIFTVTDVGKGILDTLHRRFGKVLTDIFSSKSNDEILAGAFEQKYGSTSKDINRNKGLPSIKFNFEQKTIQKLIVVCNNVILHFDNEKLSRTFEKGKPRFRGTFYQWEMTKECIENLDKE